MSNANNSSNWLGTLTIAGLVAIGMLLLAGWRFTSVGVNVGPLQVGIEPGGHGGSGSARPAAPQVPQAPQAPQAPSTADFNGSWDGSLAQQLPDGSTVSYGYRLNLEQTGNSVAGTAYLALGAPYNYAVLMKVRGTVSGSQLRYDDVQVLQNYAPAGWMWCQKSVELTSSGNSASGTWSQPGCGAGSVVMQR